MNDAYATIDQYIASFPQNIQRLLSTLRQTIKEAAPHATEAISYRMPTFKLNGNLVHFAAFKHHIGFYPTPSAITFFAKDLSAYATSKGAIQFPLNQPIPAELVKKIVAFRVNENMQKTI